MTAKGIQHGLFAAILALALSALGCPKRDDDRNAAQPAEKKAGDEKKVPDAKAAPADEKKAIDAKAADEKKAAAAKAAPAAPRNPLVGGKLKAGWNVPVGLKCQVSDSGLTNITIVLHSRLDNFPESQIPSQDRSSWKKKFTDTVKAVKDGRPSVIERKTEADSLTKKSELTGKMEPEDLPAKDSTVRMTLKDDGSVALNDDADPQVADELKRIRMGRLVPEGETAIGEEKEVPEAQVKAAIPEASGGRGKLKLVSVDLDPELKRYVAKWEGEFELEFTLPVPNETPLVSKFKGKVTLKHLPDLGIEILRKIDGKVSFERPFQNGQISGRITGNGTLQSTVSAEILPAD